MLPEPARALASGCHSVRGSMWPEHHHICWHGTGRSQRVGPGEKGSGGGMPAGLSLSCLVSIPCRSVYLPVNTTPLRSRGGQSPSATSLLCLSHPAPLSLPRLRPALLRPLRELGAQLSQAPVWLGAQTCGEEAWFGRSTCLISEPWHLSTACAHAQTQ